MKNSMAPKTAVSESVPVLDLAVMSEKGQDAEREREVESSDDSSSEDSINLIPKRLWVMHGAIMFGREFCYAMETALVTPVLLQLGLPEQYYSLTWFLSPILGLIFTPLIGSASDRCTLKWGRRKPFILPLCVGLLIGLALFLNGSLIGLSMGDVNSNQPIGIVFTMVGVVILDFCADALDGPVRAYLLDVADTEEQDMALNIHTFSAGTLSERRGFGIDCAILSCQGYISQIAVASALSAVVDAVGTVRVVPMVASGGSFLACLAAAFLVIYPETADDDEEEDEADTLNVIHQG